MSFLDTPDDRRRFGRILGAIIIVGALVTSVAVIYRTNIYPRTDDAEVFANLIGVAPQVEGPITKLYVRDNQLVHPGDLLFEVDPRPYEYALNRAKSERAMLEGQIADLARTISSQKSAVTVAAHTVRGSRANITAAEAAISAAEASVNTARAELTRAEADYAYATNNLHRLEPLLAKQYVTVDQIDQARTLQTTRAEAVRQARSRVELSQAQLQSFIAQREQASSGLSQSEAHLSQSRFSVTTLEPLLAQREAREAAVRKAEYDLNNCRVHATFDGRVTALTISEGAYARVGQQLFALIDTRTWWVIGNFRETQLQQIEPGMQADVYLMSQPGVRFDGVIDSIGYGVTPDEGTALPGNLPSVQRTLYWVHLATRFPVRVRVNHPRPELFRIGTSAMVVLRGSPSERH